MSSEDEIGGEVSARDLAELGLDRFTETSIHPSGYVEVEVDFRDRLRIPVSAKVRVRVEIEPGWRETDNE